MTELKAGRELDALIAEKVMGWERWTCSDYGYKLSILMHPGADLKATWRKVGTDVPLDEWGASDAPAYSTNIADAWLVIERMKASGWCFEIANRHSPGVYVRFGRGHYDACEDLFDEEHSSYDGAAPLAICLAALEAVGYRQESEVK